MFADPRHELPFFIVMGLEFLLLCAVLIINISGLAKMGIIWGATVSPTSKFPARRYLLISLAAAATTAVLSVVLRVIAYARYGEDFLIVGIVMLLIFIISFIVCFLTFYFAFRKAQKTGNNKIAG